MKQISFRRIRYRRKPTVETIAVTLIFVIGMAIATFIVTGNEDTPTALDNVPGTWKTQASGTSAKLQDVSFADSRNGWAVGSDGAILHTSDGGATWELQNSNTEFDLASVIGVTPNDAWAVGQFGTILHTSDAGNTWEQQGSRDITLARGLVSVAFADERNGWAFTDRGSFMLVTNDGGETWTREFFSNTSNRSDIFFLDSQKGWVLQSGGSVMRTSDGGITWTLESGLTGVTIGATAIFFLDDSHGWIAGWRGKATEFEFTQFLSDGMVARTTDGGKTWDRHDIGTGRFLWDVIFTNTLEGWSVGSLGSILYSSDGGVTWTEDQSGVDRILRAVSFPSENDGWAVGDEGIIVKYSKR